LESTLASKVKILFENHGWVVINVHGNAFTKGLPDKYCVDITPRNSSGKTFGQRWIELKRPTVGRYTIDQVYTFPLIERAGIGVWVVTEATELAYNSVVAGPPNWRNFLRPGDLTKIKKRYKWFEEVNSKFGNGSGSGS
jgi:hypothetical protein